MSVKQQTQLDLTGDLVAKSVKSFILSKRYTNILVKCSLFNIIYQRLEVEESELKTRKYKNIPFAVLKNSKTAKHPLVQSYLSWLDGIKDAMDKNYLKEIFLFMKNAAGETVEVYNFKLKYNTDLSKENKRNLIHVQDDTMALLQVLRDLGKHKKLQNIKLVIEFTYFEETPAEYEPPGFVPANQPNCAKVSVCEKFLGQVLTGFHKVTCRAHGLKDADRAFTPLPSSLPGDERASDHSIMSDESAKINMLGELICEVDIQENNDEPKKKPREPKFNTSNITISEPGDPEASLISNDEDVVPISAISYLNCFCQLCISSDGIEIIRCSQCDRQYHLPCCGYMNITDTDVGTFQCSRCSHTDNLLAEFRAKDRALFVRMRLVFYFLKKKNEIPQHLVDSLGESEKEKVLEKLRQFKVYDHETKNVDLVNLEHALPMFFNTPDSQYLM